MEPESPSKLRLSGMGFTQHKQALKTSILVLVTGLLLFGVYLHSNMGEAIVYLKGHIILWLWIAGARGPE